jgi:cytosine/adenosine deaminase-related metal-dependent hydrolase
MSTVTAWRQRDFTPIEVSSELKDIIRHSIEKTIEEEIKNGTTDPSVIFSNLKNTLEKIRKNA